MTLRSLVPSVFGQGKRGLHVLCSRVMDLSKGLTRIVLGLAGLAVLLVAGAIIVYKIIFNGTLSTVHDDWIVFGTFFGGILGPGFSALAFVAFLLTMFFQADLARQTKQQIGVMQSSLVVMQTSLNDARSQAQIIELQGVIHSFMKDIEAMKPAYDQAYTRAMAIRMKPNKAQAGLLAAGSQGFINIGSTLENLCLFVIELEKHDKHSYYASYIRSQLALLAKQLHQFHVEGQYTRTVFNLRDK